MRTFIKNIKYALHDIYRGIVNIFHWLPVIWVDRDFDWAYLARIMEFKFRRMNHSFKTFGCRNNDARELLICAELLKRLIADDEKNLNFKIHKARMDGWSEMLGKMIGKKFRAWWY
jgi:hypothetical protein